jgi:polyisoprenyl-phosphate glycosyltransferase
MGERRTDPVSAAGHALPIGAETASLEVLIPAFNEAPVLALTFVRLKQALEQLDLDWRVLIVDDGSRDRTWSIIEDLSRTEPRVRGLRLSRNFGKEAALTCALDHANADAIVVIDADLQDPPALIAEFVKHWRAGADVVYGVRTERAGESWFKKTTADAFYRLMSHVSDTPIPRNTGDFRLLSRRALDAVRSLRERNRFMKGLFAWVGFPSVAVPYQRDARAAGTTKWNYWRLWNFALDGLTSFSTGPLKVATYLGLATSLIAFVFGLFIVIKTLTVGDPVRGFPSLMVVVSFLGGIQLIALGLIGEYLGRLTLEVKQRPVYLVEAAAGTVGGAQR